MSVSVLARDDDSIRSGANLQETKLKISDLDVSKFGLVASRDVTGKMAAVCAELAHRFAGGCVKTPED